MALNYVAQRIPAGHRVREAVSTSYWPMAWPSPEAVQLKIYTGKSMLFLPMRKARLEDTQIRPFDASEAAPPLRVNMIKPQHHYWRVVRDLARDISTLEVINDDGVQLINEIGLTIVRSAKEWYTYQGDDFNSVRGETLCERSPTIGPAGSA